jgi:hypothetical protein
MASNKVFISPGVYTSEKDLTFVTRNVGVTTLGLVGETVKGPAFQPIFITNYDEFVSYFGGLNPELIKDNGAPRYELSYIAKEYLKESNQLFVTRVLGLSGYDAGYAWAITLDADLDTTTTATTQTITYNGTPNLIEFTASTTGFLNIVINDPLAQTLYNNGVLDLTEIINSFLGDNITTSPVFDKLNENSCDFSGVSLNMDIVSYGLDSNNNITGATTGVTTYYSGSCYSDVEDRVVALLRSRGRYDGNEQLFFNCTGNTIGIDPINGEMYRNPLGSFNITGTSYFDGAFSINVSLDKTKRNYISRVLGKKALDKNTPLFVEEIYENMFQDLIDSGKIRGVNSTLVYYGKEFSNYKQRYKEANTPYIVSEVRGNKVIKLFRFKTITDGDAANKEFKISITNIKPDEKLFDVEIRAFNDTDANKVVLEKFVKCNLDPSTENYIGRKIGTIDGSYPSKSKYVLVEFNSNDDISDAFPAGFLGYPMRDYQIGGNGNVSYPELQYKTTYSQFEKKRKVYLGISDTVGIDQDFFDYKGLPNTNDALSWTAYTKGFHMDITATGVTVEDSEIVINSTGGTINVIYSFDVGNAEFKNEFDLIGTDYEKIEARKFTLVPYGGFDGWDVYRTRRTNLNKYKINGSSGILGLTNGTFDNYVMSDGTQGINSDYYAYLEAIRTFENPNETNINVFATPGIDLLDNSDLVNETIEMIEEKRGDSIYLPTLPDTDSSGNPLMPEDVVSIIEGEFDSNYTAVYYPWIQINDTENNQYLWIPPTRDVVRNLALTDNKAFPWFASAGVDRGKVNAVNVRLKLNLDDTDTLYENRINPLVRFNTEGIVIMGNKNMQIKESALNRINVRRLLLQARKLISAVSIRLLFDQNDDVVRNQFLTLVTPILENIRAERGLSDFRIELDNSPESIDRRELCGKIFIKPTSSLEYICIEFNVLNTGASFEDV